MKKNNEKEVRGRAKHGKRDTRQGRVHKNGKKGTKITKKRYEAGPRTEKEVRGRAKNGKRTTRQGHVQKNEKRTTRQGKE